MQQKSEFKKTRDGYKEEFHQTDHADFYPELIPRFQKTARKLHSLIDIDVNGPPVPALRQPLQNSLSPDIISN